MAGTGKAGLKAAKILADELLDKEFFDSLKLSLKAGTAPHQIVSLLMHYKFGKPADQLLVGEIEEQDLSDLSIDELKAMIQELQEALMVAATPNTLMSERTSDENLTPH